MSQRVLWIHYKFSCSAAELGESLAPAVQPIADTPGLHWKIWLMNEAGSEAACVHLFEDQASLEAFLNGPILAAGSQDPNLSDLTVKQFDILEDFTRRTRGPVARHGSERKTFGGMAQEAFAATPAISPAEVHQRLQHEPRPLVIDVRDAADIAATGAIPGAINISYGTLTYAADNEVPDNWRDPRLADRTRPIITTCILGPLGALGAKLLCDMGFTDVSVLEGGVQAWIDAGLPVTNGGA